ncbi:ABC transporter permease [Microbacterium sp. Marseille-Q6965]|uniref:ABC transporter permease n=1 Tax=Microbacterium sp. Marseille-Q6965 TaxID=2965072 RepID=UPI0021B83754|nr:ABC transporter permease [Microbacterium sp. Marseille-Q6965]
MSGLKRFAANRLALVGLVVLLLAVLFVVVGPIVHPTEQIRTALDQANLRPGEGGHPLGTDALGYDVLGRLMLAGRTSLLVGILAGVLATVIGTLWGAIAGYVGGIVDSIMMRIVDAGIAIPAIFLLLVLSTIVRPSEWMMIVVIGLVSWLVPARLVRAESLSVKTRDYVVAARAMGATHPRVVLRHIVPNTVGTVVVNATFQVADAILLVAYVSFLGMGLQPPATDWGAMLNAGLSLIYQNAWWLILPPGIAIVVVVCALNFVGDGLRDVFDVKGRTA